MDRLVFGCSEFSLWWIAFQDFGPVLVAYHEDSKSFNVLQFVATSLRVFDLATDVGIAVTEEELFVGGLVEAEDFDVDAGERFAGDCVRNLEFAVAFQGGDLELVRVERLELLLLGSVYLNHQVQVLQLCWHLNFSSHQCIQLRVISLLWNHLLLLGMERHHVGKGFSVILDKGCACEHKFGIDVVILYHHLSYVHSFQLNRAICIHFDAVQIWFPFDALLFVFLALLCYLDIEVLGFLIKLLQLFVVELAVNFVKLVLNCQEHHPPTGDWEVVVLAYDLSRLEEVFLIGFEKF